MGVDPALHDGFPHVFIDGEKYYYGKDPEYGQYMVSHESYGKWYWCFKTRQQLVDFLENLPESSYQAVVNGEPYGLTPLYFPPAEAIRLREEHKKKLATLLKMRRELGLTQRFEIRE